MPVPPGPATVAPVITIGRLRTLMVGVVATPVRAIDAPQSR